MKIVAVVVTFNRLNLLKTVIKKLQSQKYTSPEILIVNNGSTDGTKEWLDSLSDLNVVHQKNVGGSGGFYSGFNYAINKLDADYVWCMDDDGEPNEDCLYNLVNSKVFKENKNAVVGSAVVDFDNNNKLSFSIPKLDSYKKFLDSYGEVTDDVDYIKCHGDEFGYPWGMFFNSVLIPTSVIKNVGLPKKEMFIWGDEVEYFYRIRSQGYSTYLVADSIFQHPKPKGSKVPRWKQKYQYRNYCYVDKAYKKKFLLRSLKKIVVICLAGKFFLFSPLLDGFRGDFSKSYLPK